MRSDTDSSIERTLTGVANLIDHANKRARRWVQFAQAGDHDNAMNLALEIESLLEEQPTCSRLLSTASVIKGRQNMSVLVCIEADQDKKIAEPAEGDVVKPS
jgi:hypothetical protein